MTSSTFLVNRHAFDRKLEVLNMKWQNAKTEKTFLQSLIEATEFCCLNTTLHGLRNIYESVLEYNNSTTRYRYYKTMRGTLKLHTFLQFILTIVLRYYSQSNTLRPQQFSSQHRPKIIIIQSIYQKYNYIQNTAMLKIFVNNRVADNSDIGSLLCSGFDQLFLETISDDAHNYYY